jgi:3-deoxy-D-manno-octulosonic-acid transferase
MRAIYSLAMYLATPLFLLHLAFRGLRHPSYFQRWRERFAWFKQAVRSGGIVVHAASVGEVNAASPLIQALIKRFPDRKITVTTFTPTGSEQVRTLFGESVYHVYAPLDLPGAVSRFFRHLQPQLLVIMETEIWPNLYFTARRRGLPILVANARISERSMRGYRRLSGLTRDALASVSHFAAQSDIDAERLLACGAEPEKVAVYGNLKFDVSLPPDLLEHGLMMRRQWGTERPVLLAGSTHEGEDEAVLSAFTQVLKSFPDALLILVPRHPERFTRVALLAENTGLNTALLSRDNTCGPDNACFVIDAMGALLRYYAACDIAFVGGSLVPIGGHNVLEPAALAKPVIVGPHTFNFEEIVTQLVAHGGALKIDDAQALQKAVCSLFDRNTEREQMGQAGKALASSGQGALAATLEAIDHLLDQHPSN